MLSAVEWYPVWVLEESEDPEIGIEIPEDLWARYVKARSEFDAVQEILAELHEQSSED